MSKFRYVLAAVVGAALLSACVPVPPVSPPPPTPDQIAQVDLIKGLNAEQSVYALISQYDATTAAMKGRDPSLDWGDKLQVYVGDAQTAGDGRLVCLDEQSTSGTTFSIARIAAGASAGTYYGKVACRRHRAQLRSHRSARAGSDTAGYARRVDSVTASTGWGVLHLYYRVDRERAEHDAGAAKHVVDAVAALETDGHQALTLAMLGHKADLGVIALGPDLARLQRFQHELLAGPIEPVWSYVSLTEQSEYGATEDEERARLAAEESVTGTEAEEKLAVWRERIAHYRENRVHPKLPMKRCCCFYPMSKRREPNANWYELSFDDRKELMAGHARVGRTYAGRVLQLITGSTGIDDWEWGVTLLADDIAALKEIVYEMRFDPVSTKYAEFGPFFTGLVLPPDEACARVGLQTSGGTQ